MLPLDLNKIIELNQQGFTQKEVTSYFERNNYQDVQSFLKRKKIKLIWKKRIKYPVNENFFENIDSEIKAYLLGFLYADGCLNKDGRISFCNSIDDRYVIELFRDCVCPTSKIKNVHNIKGAKNRKPQLMWRFKNKKIINDLKLLGVTENKTLNPNIVFPNISEILIPHFIRGFFDGDGSVGRRGEGNRVNFSGTWLMFFQRLKEILHLTGIKNIRITSVQGITCIYYKVDMDSWRDADIFYDYIYEKAHFFLERKYKKFYKHNTEVTAKNKDLVAP